MGAGIAARSEIVPAPFLPLVWAVVTGLLLAGLRAHLHPRFGPANAVTALRAAGVAGLAALALDPAALGALTPMVAVVAGGAILALDGIDGAAARRTGLASPFGARFDVEVDAALTLVLSVLAWRTGPAGPAILALIAPYYAFSVLRAWRPRFGRPLPPSRIRKAVCVLQVATPIALLALPLPAAAGRALVWTCLAAILASFARDLARLGQGR